MGTMAANWKSEDLGTSPFFEQLFRQVSACLYMPINGRALDKEQWESPTFVSRSPCGGLVDRDCVRSAVLPSFHGALRVLLSGSRNSALWLFRTRVIQAQH